MAKKIKVLYILANVNKSIAFEWIAKGIDSERFELSFVFLNSSKPRIAEWCEKNKVSYKFIKHEGKIRMIASFFSLYFHLLFKKPDVVHTHLLEANLIGLLAAKLCFIKKRIHTRHHSTYHHQYFPHAVRYDKWINSLSTKIIAISKVVQNTLIQKESVNKSKVVLIHHGFDLNKFRNATVSADGIRLKYDIIGSNRPVIGVISRHLKLKGIQYIIPAITELKKDYPSLLLVLANSNGPDANYIQEVLDKNLDSKDYIKIQFEEDLFSLYQIFDVFVHVPINSEVEAFGQTYVEALAAGIPSVFTKSGVANEFIENEYNALVVDYENTTSIKDAILRLLNDEALRAKLKQNGHKSVENFDLPPFIEKLEKLYE